MSTTIYGFMEKLEKYQYFWIEKSILSRDMIRYFFTIMYWYFSYFSMKIYVVGSH